MHKQDSTAQKQIINQHLQNYFRLWLEDESRKLKAIIPYVKVDGLDVIEIQIGQVFRNIEEILDLALLLGYVDISHFNTHKCALVEAEKIIRDRYEWQRKYLACENKIDFKKRRKTLLKWLLSDFIA